MMVRWRFEEEAEAAEEDASEDDEVRRANNLEMEWEENNAEQTAVRDERGEAAEDVDPPGLGGHGRNC